MNEMKAASFYETVVGLFRMGSEAKLEEFTADDFDFFLGNIALNAPQFGELFDAAKPELRNQFVDVFSDRLLKAINFDTTTKTLDVSQLQTAFLETAQRLKAL
ncbi:MAG: hypothetical protein ABJV68_18935 [Paracoccaceae bacterium]